MAENSLATRGRRPGVRGFTLIEILIVVVILGILAAIVVPQFTNASTLSRQNALKDNLQLLRTQLPVYQAQHRDVPLGFQNGALASSPATVVVNQLTQCTDVSGDTSTGSSTTYAYGPYLQAMPANSLNNLTTVKVLTGTTVLTADNSTGWIYNATTQQIVANSTGADSDGTSYIQY